jgi:hypothetical protein
MSTYNGWSNYETWRVNLEMFDGMDPTDLWDTRADDVDSLTMALADSLESIAEDMALQGVGEDGGFAASLVHHFLRQVNWREIAEHMVDDYRDQLPDHLTAAEAEA